MHLSCIVCASDGSDASHTVVASAMALAEWEDAELHVVQLADPASERSGPSLVVRKRSTTVVRGGDPASAVIDHARRVRADLIVVGTTLAAAATDRPASLPEVIARAAHCPTLIVPLLTLRRRRLDADLIVMGLASRVTTERPARIVETRFWRTTARGRYIRVE